VVDRNSTSAGCVTEWRFKTKSLSIGIIEVSAAFTFSMKSVNISLLAAASFRWKNRRAPSPRMSNTPSCVKVGIFFSHPNQHHSIMFQQLAKAPDVDLKVYYFDPGSLAGMYDPSFGTDHRWDVDILSGTDSKILYNVFRGREVAIGSYQTSIDIRAAAL
jgi:hypothetical protein